MKRLLLCLLVLWPALAWSQTKPTHHIILLDISGSMRTKGYATRAAWTDALPTLLSKLMASGDSAFQESDTVQLQPFSDPTTDAKEGRQLFGPFSLKEWPSRLSGLPVPGSGATDMGRALDMGNELSKAAGERSLTWLLTDNEDHLGQNQDDVKFYSRLRDSGDYSHVVFFPLADPKARPGDSLVMYLLVPKGQWEGGEVERIVQEVQKKTGYDGLVFRPLYNDPGSTPLDFSKELTVDGPHKYRISQEGGATVLYFQEGDKLQGNLRFKIRSRLRGWKLTGARLEDAQVELDIPPPYAHSGNRKVSWQVTPKALEVEPQKDSVDFFLLQLRGPDDQPLELSRSAGARLADPGARYLPEITGKVKMSATLDLQSDQIKPALTEEQHIRLQAVQNLGDIEKFMASQVDAGGSSGNQRVIEWQRNILIRVEADSLPALLMGIVALLVGGLLLALAVAALLIKRTYELEGPGIQEEIQLGYLSGRYLICSANGTPLCSLRMKVGSLSLVAEPDCQFPNAALLLPVTWEGDEFRFEVGPEGKPAEVFRLHRRASGSSSGGDSGAPVL